MIYLDHGATSLLKPPQVYAAVLSAMKTCASVGRGGYAASMRAAETVHRCREEAAALFEGSPEQVVFTMNATHGLNLAIHSLCRPGMPVAISGFEHNAVLRPLHAMGARIMICGRQLFQPREALEDFRQALDRGAELVVCTYCSNVFGYVLPVEELSRLCRSRGVPLILDASQAAGTLPVSLKRTGAAFIAMPGHKGLYGPQGTGILLCSAGGEPLLYGGTGGSSLDREMPPVLPDRLEAGTHNVCGIAGLLEGIRYVRKKKPERILERERTLLQPIVKDLSRISSVRLFRGAGQTGVLSFTVENADAEEIAQKFAIAGVCLRAGLHCAPLAHESAGTAPFGTVRISVSDRNRETELRSFRMICKKIL
ncbi:MAG: aminotransferase class V-fold PLP-dependent enzyme [Oscillospiraceae bacterium]|nr:aminotransferase class V-fold PLP-dependent enzyme [Oscillospiraceae bacterium]